MKVLRLTCQETLAYLHILGPLYTVQRRLAEAGEKAITVLG